MSLWITDDVMVSEDTEHEARRVEGGWALSWLPGRVLDRNQAVTGMTLSEMTSESAGLEPGGPRSRLLRGLAAELGLTGPEVIERTTTPPAAEDAMDSDANSLPGSRPAEDDAVWVDES